MHRFDQVISPFEIRLVEEQQMFGKVVSVLLVREHISSPTVLIRMKMQDEIRMNLMRRHIGGGGGRCLCGNRSDSGGPVDSIVEPSCPNTLVHLKFYGKEICVRAKENRFEDEPSFLLICARLFIFGGNVELTSTPLRHSSSSFDQGKKTRDVLVFSGEFISIATVNNGIKDAEKSFYLN